MKKNLLFILAALTVLHFNGQVGYHIQLPVGYGTSIYVLNNDSVYLSNGITNNANMMHIDPNTKAWKYLNGSSLPNYGYPLIKDKNNGILRLPGSNSLQVTSDGWQTVTTSTASLPYINKCPAGYYGYYNIGSTTYLTRSTNGLIWTDATMSGFFSGIAARNFGNKIVALPATQSFSFQISMDGGLTYTAAANTSTFTGTFVEFYMASADTFLVFMNSTLCKSFNGGATWTNTPLPVTINAVAIKNKNEFVITGSGGPNTFTYTTNGGSTWSSSVNTPPVAGAGSIMYLNNYYYMYPWFRTNDYGTTWEQFLPNVAQAAFSVDFNGNKGLLGLGSGKYSYSLDKGRSLTNFTNTINSNQDIMAVKVLSSGNFLAGDRKGQIYTSNDNGQTWIKKNTETLNLNAVRFLSSVNENTIVATRAGLPVVSIDAGNTFSVVTYSISGGSHYQALKPNGEIMDIRAIANGWEMRKFDVTGSTTVIATYTNATNEDVAAFYMVSNTVGYILTRDNTAKTNKTYRTTDGGLTFTQTGTIGQVVTGASAYVNSPFVSGIPLFHHFGTDTIIITANYNDYYHISYDGAATWNKIVPPFVPGNTTYGNMIYRMNFFTHNSFFAVTGDAFGPKGLYLNTSGVGGPSIGISELNFQDQKNNVVLFPNPSLNGDLVSLLNMNEEVQIDIYDMKGQLVRAVTTYSGSFSIQNLDTGLYLVQVKEKNKPARTAKLLIQ